MANQIINLEELLASVDYSKDTPSYVNDDREAGYASLQMHKGKKYICYNNQLIPEEIRAKFHLPNNKPFDDKGNTKHQMTGERPEALFKFIKLCMTKFNLDYEQVCEEFKIKNHLEEKTLIELGLKSK